MTRNAESLSGRPRDDNKLYNINSNIVRNVKLISVKNFGKVKFFGQRCGPAYDYDLLLMIYIEDYDLFNLQTPHGYPS